MSDYYDKQDINRMVDGFKKHVDGHFKILNGKVDKNTRYRYILMGIGAVLTVIIIPISLVMLEAFISPPELDQEQFEMVIKKYLSEDIYKVIK